MSVTTLDEKPILCDCGKLIAKERSGKIYVWCKACRKEVELKVEKDAEKSAISK